MLGIMQGLSPVLSRDRGFPFQEAAFLNSNKSIQRKKIMPTPRKQQRTKVRRKLHSEAPAWPRVVRLGMIYKESDTVVVAVFEEPVIVRGLPRILDQNGAAAVAVERVEGNDNALRATFATGAAAGASYRLPQNDAAWCGQNGEALEGGVYVAGTGMVGQLTPLVRITDVFRTQAFSSTLIWQFNRPVDPVLVAKLTPVEWAPPVSILGTGANWEVDYSMGYSDGTPFGDGVPQWQFFAEDYTAGGTDGVNWLVGYSIALPAS